MKSIFNTSEQQDIRERLEKLTPNTPALWGKMNVSQMISHCTCAMQMPTDEIPMKNAPWLIRQIGKMIKKRVLGDAPLSRNSPTAPEIKMTTPKEFNAEKERFLIALDKLSKGELVVKREIHPFFGKMTPQEWGQLNYKHTDHHFQQFGV
jgi:hypothetical protein